ncbi:lysophospholipid acyltransferase family protein [Deinococcus yavapaiensis]|uniref:1-acyl-sn-glycerol-3-phosphate acyltransferase n=1 Tax=Deinococcus yavapaiensis KR-236 TaxID=694435 RepID=A0A318SAP2_9DEIO|nr:lysophospholipid acyltransferase family protein [Deinococcus yavapaiensis]PYE53598.1 1-acyl-sn-glycerol-3-phosphate acyltransferase [Deinococcus yavapaiensis KR-236]
MTKTDVPTAKAPTVNPFMYALVCFTTGIPIYLQGTLHVEGREHVPLTGRVIVAGNHESGLDPFVIAQALPKERKVQFMAKKELFQNPVLRYVIGTGGSFPVDREGNDVGAVRTALRILQAEGMVGIFPEGTRGGTELHGGVALIALKAKAPIVPVSVAKVKRRWLVRFGAPIPPEGRIRELTERVGRTIAELRPT